MDAAFEGYYKTKKAGDRLNELRDETNTEHQKLIEGLKELEESFNAAREEAQDTALSEDAREEKRAEAEAKLGEIRDLEQEIKQYEVTHGRQLEEQRRRMRKRIVDEITEVVEEFAEDRGLFAVVDRSGLSLNQVPVFIYTDAGADITEEIIGVLNESMPEDFEWEIEEEPESESGEDAGQDSGGAAAPAP
jgi:Skp family chaperone for outer membrane proteins